MPWETSPGCWPWDWLDRQKGGGTKHKVPLRRKMDERGLFLQWNPPVIRDPFYKHNVEGGEQAAGRDVHHGTSHVGVKHTTQRHAPFTDTDRWADIVQTRGRTGYVRVRAEVTSGERGERERKLLCCIYNVSLLPKISHTYAKCPHLSNIHGRLGISYVVSPI